jgi:hypothetical protein
MGLLTERDGAGDGFEEVTIPLVPIDMEVAVAPGLPAPRGAAPASEAARVAAGYGAGGHAAARNGAPANAGVGSTAAGNGAARAHPADGGVILRRRSELPSRRCVLYLHCQRDPFVPEDLVLWYTERGFNFYVADLRPPEDRPARRRARPGHGERIARLDAACRHLREAEGIDMIIVSAHGAGALTAALWCDARRDAGSADALILTRPAFGRRLRRGLDITCPVLVLSPAGVTPRRAARRRTDGAVRLGPHVTWLGLADGLDGRTPDAPEGRRRFFDEMGRWLGAYMYGSVRDQLL